MRVVAMIPARAGSKRMHQKNTRLLAGRALWQHAVEHARDSGVVHFIAISTNDPIIQNSRADALIIHRPERLCRDEVPMLPVIAHAYAEIKGLASEFDAVCILQPSSPLRTGEDIAECVRIMKDTGAESVVSVTEGPDDLCFIERYAGRMERVRRIIVPNGAIYLLKVEALEAGRDWYGDFAYRYIMPKERSLDIDFNFDFETAERYLAQKEASNGKDHGARQAKVC